MQRTHLAIAASATVVGAAMLWASQQSAQDTGSILDTAMDTINRTLGRWAPPAQYAQAIADAEDASGIPRDLLARLLYQECRWRADIISGATVSPVGALGIAQFMPQTAAERGVDPLDPDSAIPGAARYLRWLHDQTGTWAQALAAYNWGIGNVQRKGLAKAPAETVAYYSSILADVNAANGSNLA